MTKRLGQSFYNVGAKELAISLLGKILVRKLDSGETLKGRIVEIESHPGPEDISNKKENNEPITAGTTLVHVRCCQYYLNISSRDGVVLIRAIEPVAGVEKMIAHRNINKKKSRICKDTEIANGPTMLCTAMYINRRNCNMLNLTKDKSFWVEDDSFSIPIMVATSMITAPSAEVTGDNKPYRFYIYQNPHVSKHKLKETD